eukprot:2880514-Rhodomonas_salina.1
MAEESGMTHLLAVSRFGKRGVRWVNAHGKGGEEALEGVALVDGNRPWTHTHLRWAMGTKENWAAGLVCLHGNANARSVNGASSCAAGWGVRQVGYCHAETGGYELQRVASALAEGACSRKDKTDNAILLGDVRCCQSGRPDSRGTWGATDQG